MTECAWLGKSSAGVAFGLGARWRRGSGGAGLGDGLASGRPRFQAWNSFKGCVGEGLRLADRSFETNFT